MNHEEAMQCALGYAWGREDASDVKTAEAPDRVGCHDFAAAFAKGWDDYNAGKRGFMTNALDAYEAWQATNGKGIFPAAPEVASARQANRSADMEAGA